MGSPHVVEAAAQDLAGPPRSRAGRPSAPRRPRPRRGIQNNRPRRARCRETARRADRRAWRVRRDGRSGLADDDEALGLELRKAIAQGGPGDAELGGQLALGDQPLAWAQHPLDDQRLNAFGDRIRQTGGFDGDAQLASPLNAGGIPALGARLVDRPPLTQPALLHPRLLSARKARHPSGAGRGRFIDEWFCGGCLDPAFAGDDRTATPLFQRSAALGKSDGLAGSR